MEELSKDGAYTITEDMKAAMADFVGGYASESENAEGIKALYDATGYVIDTHTGVASRVYRDYKAKTGDQTPTVIASTASPFKFSHSVMEAINGDQSGKDEFAIVDELSQVANVPVPNAVEEIRHAEIRHRRESDPDLASMEATVAEILGL
jgi:threonine synthase